jgi:hypothetical protein
MLLFLLVLSVKLTYDLSRVRDLCVADEAGYMLLAWHIPDRGLPPAEVGPLYCLWYQGLSLVQPDPVRLHDLSLQVLSFLVPASLYLLCRALAAGRAASLLMAFLVLTSAALEVMPYPSYLAFSVLALGTALAVRARTWPWHVAKLGVTLLLASYVRPELALSVLLYGLAAFSACLWVVLRQRQQAPRLLLPALLVLACATVLHCGLGTPLGGGRSFIAFGQHYAANVVQAEQLALNPWGSSYDCIVERDFGTASTVRQAWEANPRAFLWHIGVNVRQTPQAIGQLIRTKLDLPAAHHLLAGAAVLALGGWIGRLRRPEESASRRKGSATALIMLALVLAPALLSAFLIHPRLHYLMPAVLLLLAVLGGGLAGFPRWGGPKSQLARLPLLLGVFILLLAITPNRAHGWHVQHLLGRRQPASGPLVQRKTVAALRRLSIGTPTAILTYAAPGHPFYARMPAEFVCMVVKAGPFWDFVRQRAIGVIVLDSLLLDNPAYRNDTEFQEFVAGKRTGDFAFLDVPGLTVRIAVRKDLLSEAAITLPAPSSSSADASSGGAARSIAPDTGG